MAKKTRAKLQVKTKAKPKTKAAAPVKTAPAARPVAAPEAVRLHPELTKVMLSPLELTALILGFVALIVGAVWAILEVRAPVSYPEVKNQTIPMTMDDFKGDPSLQQAIQKQLGGNGAAGPAQQVQPSQNVGGQLQSTATGLQAQ